MEDDAKNLKTYLADHAAGAQFAVSLLQDLSQGCAVKDASRVAAELLGEVESDRQVLQHILERTGTTQSALKDAGAWIAQRIARLKLRLADPMGVFEAVELLQLGVQGKLALWYALGAIEHATPELSGIDLSDLAKRAEQQAVTLEKLRLQLATIALKPDSSKRSVD